MKPFPFKLGLLSILGALMISQSKAEDSPNVKNQENDVKIPVSVQSEPYGKVGATEVVNVTPDYAGATSENGLKRIGVSMAEVESITEQAVALNGGGIQNITVNNLVDENNTGRDGKQQNVFKGGIVGTTTVKSVDGDEKSLIENAVVLTGNGLADTPFVADDVINENVTQGNVSANATVTRIAQFGKDIQARATDDATEKSNKTVSTEEDQNTKVVKVKDFHFETKLDSNNGGNKLVSVDVAMKNNQTTTIVFQFPINIYVDHVNKKTGFITRLKKNEASKPNDTYIADKIKELIKKSKDNVKEDNATGNTPLAQKPEPTKVQLLRY